MRLALIQYEWYPYKYGKITDGYRRRTLCGQSQAKETGLEWLFLHSPQEKLPTPWTSGWKNYEKINFCCLSPSQWSFFIASPEN
jgi:hypothetical protein